MSQSQVPDSSETTDLFDRAEETTDAPAEETTDAADDTELPGGGDDLSARRVFFVGISGPSCAGKSKLATSLAAQLKSPVNPIPLDGYFVPARMTSHPKYGQNWETPEGLDFQSLLDDIHLVERILSSAEVVPDKLVIKAAASRGGGDIIRKGVARTPLLGSQPIVVVVEGFLLFYDPSVAVLFDAHLWLQADSQTCMRRRHQRDAPGVPESRFSEWYHGLVWDHFLKYQDRQLANADGALRLEGRESSDVILEKAVAYCQARLGLR
jgi:uridine kinase